MRRTPEIDAWLHQRLRLAVDDLEGGSADEFGRMLGYLNGGSVRQSLRGVRRVQQAILDRAETAADARLHDWFKPPAELLPAEPLMIQGGISVLTDELNNAIAQKAPQEQLALENALRALLGMPALSMKALKGNGAQV